MVRTHIKRFLIFGLFLVSLGGFGLHFLIHSPSKVAYGYVPFCAGLISVILIPVFFSFKRTLHLAHLLNGFTAIIGIITMGYYSLVMRPLYPDLAFLLSKFVIGRAIFEFELYQNLDTQMSAPGWKIIRYPNMGFWYVHLVVLSVVYALGHMLWTR